MKDFFVSYNRHDRAWAEWIAWTLEEAGYSVVIQAWDFRAGGNFVLNMQKAASEAERTIAVLSETYLKSEFTAPEWAAAFAQDPTGKNRTLIPVRVKECQLSGLLAPIVYIDLVDVAEADAQGVLLRSLAQDRAKPEQKPRFPGSAASLSDRPKPVFPPSIPCNLPLVSAIFVGREKDLEELHTLVQLKAMIAISAVSGMGGIGKTELAAQYALQQRDMGTYPGGICWLKAREDLKTQIVLFARSQLALMIPEDLELAEQVALCWRNWHPGETLLVFDDVQQYQDIVPVLPPQRSQFRVLLTTRLTLQSPVQSFEIKVLSEEKAIELLRAIVPDGRIDQDLAIAKQVCEWLGYLPLGLELVGRYLARKQDLSAATVWQRLQDKRLEAKALKDAAPGMTATLGVTAAFKLSWDVLDEPAQQLATVLSLFALAEIPWMLVEACFPEKYAEPLEDLRDESLLNLHLLERNGQGVYQLHQLLREFFAANREQRADTYAMKQAFCGAVIKAVKRIIGMPKRSLFAETSVLMPHLQVVVQLSETFGQPTDVAHNLSQMAELYQVQGRYVEAEPLFLRALAIGEQQLSADHPNVATWLNNLAALYSTQGRYVEAEPLFLRALAIGKQHLGTDHPDVAARLNNLALLHNAQGHYVEAEPLFLRALAIGEQHLGADHLNVSATLSNLANLHCDQGRYVEAEPLHLRALAISELHLGLNHPDVAIKLNNLANLYRVQGRYVEAEPLFLRASAISEQHLGADHPDVAIRLNNLANLYQVQGRYVEAESLYLRALAIGEQHLGADHPNVATWLNNLANLYSDQGRYVEAEPLYLRALAIGERHLGADHPDVTARLNNLALLYSDQGRYVEAEPLYLRGLVISEQHLGADHPDVSTTLNNLANLYYAQGRYMEAEPLYLKASAILVNSLGTNHPNIRLYNNNLANLYDAMSADFKLQGHYDKVAEYLQKAITLRSQLLQ